MSDERRIIRLAYPVVSRAVLPTIEAILASGQLTRGEYCRRFAAELARVHEVAEAIPCNSGTSALLAVMQALEIGPGDRVAVPDYGFPATANVVEAVGATPVFVDVDADDFGLSPTALAETIDGPIKAVIVVHQFGLPAKFDRIAAWAREHEAAVIEDSACTIGTRIDGHYLGCLGVVGILSFHPRKVVTTGEGGAILVRDTQLAERLRALADHGFEGPEKRMRVVGMNLHLPEISCAIGLEQLDRLPQIIAARRQVGKWYEELLAGLDRLTLPHTATNVEWNNQTYTVVLAAEVERDRVRQAMNEAGIETNVPAVSLSDLEFYRRKYELPETQVSVSRELQRCAMALPCHERMTYEEALRVGWALKQALEHR